MADDAALHGLTAAYALDALAPDEERAYVAHLAGCERCRHDLAELTEAAAALAYAAPPAEPPAALRSRILVAARAERSNVVPLRPRWAYPAVAAAAVAACTAIGLGTWAATLQHRLGSRHAAVHAVALRGASGSLVVADGQGTLVLTGLDRAPTGKTYEAWVVQGGTPAPAGLFRGGGTTVVRLTRRVPQDAVVAVTLERQGGSARPTSEPLVVSARV